MRTRLCLILCLVAALFLTACSSTTVVARDERGTATDDDESTASATVDAEDETTDDDASSGGVDPTPAGDDNDEADEDDTDGEDDEDDTDDSDSADTDDDATDLGDGAGFGLGGAEQLEALLDDCEGGSDLACDVLFQISAFDSPEEDAAVTCGGRSAAEVTFCTDGIEALDDELVFDPESDGIDDVVDLCEDDGDMTACDFLYYRSPIDSDLQEVGGTCGGRVTVAVPDCRTLLAEADDG